MSSATPSLGVMGYLIASLIARTPVTRLDQEFTCKYNVLNWLGKFDIAVLTQASAHPPILTVLWFFRVLCMGSAES